jgi:hypothetical protein
MHACSLHEKMSPNWTSNLKHHFSVGTITFFAWT